jgi:hypothetical protein
MRGCICGRCNGIKKISDEYVEVTENEFNRVLTIQNWTRRNVSNGEYYSTVSFIPQTFAIRLLHHSKPTEYFLKK